MTAGGIPAAPVFAYAGEDITFTFTLTAGGVPTDPTSAVMSYGLTTAGAGSAVTVPLSALTHLGAGSFAYTLDTTALAAGLYAVQIIATGNVFSVDVQFFIIEQRPLG